MPPEIDIARDSPTCHLASTAPDHDRPPAGGESPWRQIPVLSSGVARPSPRSQGLTIKRSPTSSPPRPGSREVPWFSCSPWGLWCNYCWSIKILNCLVWLFSRGLLAMGDQGLMPPTTEAPGSQEYSNFFTTLRWWFYRGDFFLWIQKFYINNHM